MTFPLPDWVPEYEIGRWVQLTGQVTCKDTNHVPETDETQYIVRLKVPDYKAERSSREKLKYHFVNVVFYDHPNHPSDYLENLEKGQEVVADCVTCLPQLYTNLKEYVGIRNVESKLRGMFIKDVTAENGWEGYKEVLTTDYFVDDTI